MSPFDMARAGVLAKIPTARWLGIEPGSRDGRFTAHLKCDDCGTEIEWTAPKMPAPEIVVGKFKAKGWRHQHKKWTCPNHKAPKAAPAPAEPKEKPMSDPKPVLRGIPTGGSIVAPATPSPAPSDAARNQRRLAFMSIEEAYDEAAKRYRPGFSDATIAAELKMAENAIKLIREEFFGPAAPPEPPEIIALRQELETAGDQAQTFRADADKMASQASALEGHVATLKQRLDRICIANGW